MQQTNKNLKYFYFSLCPTRFCIDISRKKKLLQRLFFNNGRLEKIYKHILMRKIVYLFNIKVSVGNYL